MKNRIIIYLIFLFIFLIYLKTLNPVFHADDSPETIACSYTLGIQHPPGYPLPTLIGKIFAKIPVGNTGFRVNLQAAFFSVLTLVILYLMLLNFFTKEKRLFNYFIALLPVLTFAFSYTFWSQTLSAKGGIYILNAFLLTLLIFIIFYWQRSEKDKYFYLFIFLYGLSLGNHWESMAVSFPAFLFFIILNLKKLQVSFTIKKIFISAMFFISGIFIYYYLIIRARSGIYLNWGDPVDLKQLIWVITRAEYTSLEKAREISVVIKQVGRIFNHLLFEFTIAGFFLSFSGGYYLIKNNKKTHFVFLITLILCVLLSLSLYLNLKDEMLWILDVFLIPAYVAMVILIYAGILFFLQFKNIMIKVLFIILFLFIPFFNLITNYKKTDQSNYFYAYDFGMNIIKSIDNQNSIGMLEGDFAVMPIMYFRYVEKKVNFCPVTTIFLYVPWSVKNIKIECPEIKFTSKPEDSLSSKINNIISLNFREKEIYTSIFRDVMKEFAPDIHKYLVCNGLSMKLTVNKLETLKNGLKNFKILSYRNLLDNKLFLDSSTKFCLNNYSSAYLELANGLRDFNIDKLALKVFKNAVTLANENTKAECLTHLGIQYAKMEEYQKAIELYKEAIKLKPKLIEAYSNLAGVYNTLKNYDEGIKYAREAIKIKPDFSEAYNNLAVAYYYKGEKEEALKNMEIAVKLNPTNELARQNLEILKKELKK